jgi:hypothetical protein
MNIPMWLHPIVRRIFSGLVNDAWTKAGRPILAENVQVYEVPTTDHGRCQQVLFDLTKSLTPGTRVYAFVVEEERCDVCADGKRLSPGWKCDICGRVNETEEEK